MDNESRTAAEPDLDSDLDVSDIPPISVQRTGQLSGGSVGREALSHQSRNEAFYRLPDKIIERILYQVDANTFASLVLLNRRWRALSQDILLYAHHLSRCPSFALTHNVITGPFRSRDLERYRAAFSQEVRRNLFEAYLRPRHTQINLISVGASTSAALPRSDAFRFVFSPSGRMLLALSSSRIYVLDIGGEDITVQRQLKTLRRPVSAAISNDGTILAVLSTTHQVNIYELTPRGVQHLQVLVMDQPPRTITLAQEGTVLAVAYESAVEVFSLAENALSTDRRAVRCEPVDSLTFSEDGSMLVGSSKLSDPGNTVVITAPYYTENDPNLSGREIHSRLWTTQILFPTSSSTCHMSSFLPSHSEGDAQWLFTYDHVLGTFRAVRTDDTRIGAVYFIGPRSRREFMTFKPTLIPATNTDGDLAVTGFDNNRIYIYGVPQKVDLAPDMSHVLEPDDDPGPWTSATVNRASLAVYSPPLSSISSESSEEDDLYCKVDWRQSLFVKGRRLGEIKGASGMRWVENSKTPDRPSSASRLVVTAPGGVDSLAEGLGEEPMPVDGGRIYLFDFDYSVRDGAAEEITIEVGESQPEILPEHHSNIDVEVALERRRSVLRNNRNHGGNRSSLARAATEGASPLGRWPMDTPDSPTSQPVLARNRVYQPGPTTLFPDPTLADTGQARQHTVAANPPRGIRQLTSYLSNQPTAHVAYHRQQMPHESDADNWVPPPPPYKRSAETIAETLLTPELRLSMLGTFSESNRRTGSESFPPPNRANTIPEEAELIVAANITDLTRSSTLPRPSYRTRPLSDSSLSTLSDWSTFHYRRRDTGSNQASSGDDIISPISRSTSEQATPTRRANQRPTSSTASDSQPVLRANLTQPTSPIPLTGSPLREPPPSPPAATSGTNRSNFPRISPPHIPASETASPTRLHSPSANPPPSHNSSPSSSPSTPRSITLTGKNLQSRLNYPTPPLPPEARTAQSAPYSEVMAAQVASPPEQPFATSHSGPSSDNSTRQMTGPPPASTIAASDPQPQHPPPPPTTAVRSFSSQSLRWPQHRKPIPTSGHHLDPTHLNPSSAPLPRSNTSPDIPSTSNVPPESTMPSTTITHDFAQPNQRPSVPRRHSSQSPNRARHPGRRDSTDPTTPRPKNKRLASKLNPFSSSSSKPKAPPQPNMASIHGGYGPHGAGPHPGGHPEKHGSKFAKLETIKSIASQQSTGSGNGQAASEQNNEGGALRRLSDKGRQVQEHADKCDVM